MWTPKPKKPGQKNNPEKQIQKNICIFLRARGWSVAETHATYQQAGFPDLWASHVSVGGRWIEVKLPNMIGSRFTKEQLIWFPEFGNNGTQIWILTGATETEYKKLFQPPNWFEYYMQKI